MKSKLNLFGAICILIFTHSLTFGNSDSTLSKGRPATAWEEVDQTSEIMFYERWVSLSETKQTRERKGVFYLDGYSDQIVNSICVAENIEEWMIGAKEVYVIWTARNDPSVFVTQTATKVFGDTESSLEFFKKKGYVRQ